MALTIYHNPRCSKSRQTLQLLHERGLQPAVVEYLKTPPDTSTLSGLLTMLEMGPRDLMRKGEKVYKELGLADTALSDDQLIQAMADNPILMERPVVVHDGRAALGRPPEAVLEIV